jgi:hypothetical protein
MRISRCIACPLLAVLTAGRLPAAQPPAVPPDENAITAAKRDYEIIKGTRASLEQQRLDSPVKSPASTPLPAGEGAAESSAPVRRSGPVAKPGRSATWLLDAMNERKETGPLEELKGGAAPGDAGRERALALERSAASQETKLASAAPKPGDRTDNPLTSFMAAWMTPQDYDLLKVKNPEGAPAAAERLPAGEHPAAGNFLDNSLRSDAPGSAGHAAAPGGGLALEPRSNPYLADLAPGFAGGTKDLGAGPNPAAPALAPPVLAAPVLAAPALKNDFEPLKNQPQPGDQFKLQDDSKYFPQLKRF